MFWLTDILLVRMEKQKSNVMGHIKNSKYFKDFVDSFEDGVKIRESQSYLYRPDGLPEHYLVVLRIDSPKFDKMNLIFKMTEEDQVVDAEAHVDVMGGKGKPEEVDNMEIRDSLQDKIKKLKDND